MHDKVGELEFALHEVVTAPNQILVKALENSSGQTGKNGSISITGEEKVESKNNEEFNFTLALDKPSSQQGLNFFLVYKQIGLQ